MTKEVDNYLSAIAHGLESKAFVRGYPERRRGNNGPLHGLTFSVKDNISVKEAPLTLGLTTPIFDRAVADAALIDTLEKLGATLLGSTHMDAAALGCLGESEIFGVFKNPRYPETPLGGSSCGAALAVALGSTDFGVGTDWGGSIRIPATACGLFGLKLSSGTLDSKGVVLYDDRMDSIGLIGRELSTLERIVRAVKPNEQNRPYAITVFKSPSYAGINEKYLAEFFKIAEQIGRTELDLDLDFKEICRVRKILAANQFAKASATLPQIPEDAAKALLHLSKTTSETELKDAENFRKEMSRKLDPILAAGHILLTPIFPEPFIREFRSDTPPWHFLTLANLIEIPALSIPLEVDGTPMGLQLLGAQGSELALLLAAKAFT